MTRCRHFGTCGGCAHQDMAEAPYRAFKRALVADALARHGIEAPVGDIVEVPPATRRRATFKALRGEGVALGFHAARSHDIVDMRECLVLTQRLAALVPGLRAMLAALLAPNEGAELHVADTDTGIDFSLIWRKRAGDAAVAAELARWAGKLKLARIAVNGETLVELQKPAMRFGKAMVALPPQAFLQPTREGEAVLQALVLDALSGAKRVADLFAGCGTFSLPLAERARVHAVEIDGAMLEALAAAARATLGLKPVTSEKRNLFRRPLTEAELVAYDAVVLDPPRAGALDQAKALAASKVKRIAYVSCDAESFARDARILIDGGYTLARVTAVDQFLWSAHIELAALFARG